MYPHGMGSFDLRCESVTLNFVDSSLIIYTMVQISHLAAYIMYWVQVTGNAECLHTANVVTSVYHFKLTCSISEFCSTTSVHQLHIHCFSCLHMYGYTRMIIALMSTCHIAIYIRTYMVTTMF